MFVASACPEKATWRIGSCLRVIAVNLGQRPALHPAVRAGHIGERRLVVALSRKKTGFDHDFRVRGNFDVDRPGSYQPHRLTLEPAGERALVNTERSPVAGGQGHCRRRRWNDRDIERTVSLFLSPEDVGDVGDRGQRGHEGSGIPLHEPIDPYVAPARIRVLHERETHRDVSAGILRVMPNQRYVVERGVVALEDDLLHRPFIDGLGIDRVAEPLTQLCSELRLLGTEHRRRRSADRRRARLTTRQSS